MPAASGGLLKGAVEDMTEPPCPPVGFFGPACTGLKDDNLHPRDSAGMRSRSGAREDRGRSKRDGTIAGTSRVPGRMGGEKAASRKRPGGKQASRPRARLWRAFGAPLRPPAPCAQIGCKPGACGLERRRSMHARASSAPAAVLSGERESGRDVPQRGILPAVLGRQRRLMGAGKGDEVQPAATGGIGGRAGATADGRHRECAARRNGGIGGRDDLPLGSALSGTVSGMRAAASPHSACPRRLPGTGAPAPCRPSLP